MARTNEFDQPIGRDLDGWTAPGPPTNRVRRGRTVTLEPLHPSHADPLHAAFADADESLWTYMSWGPFASVAEVAAHIENQREAHAWQAYAVVVDGAAVGEMSYLNIAPAQGSIEIGAIAFSPRLQRTTAATEAIFLLIDGAFDAGYRRVEWKCDDLNAPSRAAALRYGFTYEGTFRNATHYKGRSRDTAWFAIVDDDWPRIRVAFRGWLAPENFSDGRQVQPLDTSA